MTASATSDFSGRTVLVTGAGRGIGEAVATCFAERAADVVMVDLDADVLARAAAKIDARFVVADVSSSGDVARMVGVAVAEMGRVDVLVNNAGIVRDAMLWKLTDEDWEAVLSVHLGGTFRCTRACVPIFRAQEYGRVVNVTSYTGLHGNIGQAAYAAAKAGIIGFTKTAAKELARFGVTVNAVSPNAETRMVAGIPEETRTRLERMTPAGRFGAPSEISVAVSFLAAEESGYITGVVLPVDGGLSM